MAYKPASGEQGAEERTDQLQDNWSSTSKKDKVRNYIPFSAAAKKHITYLGKTSSQQLNPLHISLYILQRIFLLNHLCNSYLLNAVFTNLQLVLR